MQAADAVVALARGVAHLPPEALAAVPGLAAPSERERVAEALAHVPELVAGFEGSGSGWGPPSGSRSAAPSLVAASAPPIPADGERAVRFQVLVRLGRGLQEYVATAMSADVVALEGERPLPENRLLEATLRCGPEPFAVWGLARLRGAAASGAARAELKPWALSREAHRRWSGLLAEARASASP